MIYTQETIRLEARLDTHGSMLSAWTSATPALWRGGSWRFDLACFVDDVLVEVSGLASLTLEIKALSNPTGAAILSKTIDSSLIDNDTTIATWKAGTAQHAYFEFSNVDTNLDLAGANTANFFLTIKGQTNEVPSKRVIIGVSILRVDEAGANDTAPPAAGDPDYYTKAQADAQFIQDIAVESPIESTGGRSPTLSLAPGTVVGQLLMWDGAAWIPGNVGGDLLVLCAEDGKLCPITAYLLPDGKHAIGLAEPAN